VEVNVRCRLWSVSSQEKYTIYADRKAGAPLLYELFIHIYEADFFRIKIHIFNSTFRYKEDV
jgi:hypothetical protein